MNTVEELKDYIKETFSIEPTEFDGTVLKYHSIEFERSKASALTSNKSTADMWSVRRSGHSVDFFRTEELENAVSKRGSLPYYFVPR